jgi:osmotically inducible protein OsmC
MENFKNGKIVADVTNQIDIEVLYTAKTHTTGGRDGASKSSDGVLDVKLARPGSSTVGTNPEQLFAAGWSACFISAMRIAAGQMKVRFPHDAAIDAEVDLANAEGGFVLQTRLNISLPGMDRELALSIVKAGENTCPYSKAVRGNIKTEFNLI